ncbi:GIY-YIG nuclease family protein [Metabacillus fastidiosus]|uniref:GIY-YIG nuclease family protein n=1 Tax=Metabacillus fastidiosus TaxID=1458 RepID=UPI003D2C5E3D
MELCGIYMILNLINNKIYIGSSINIKKRWQAHKSYLNINQHSNRYLQNAWNKYGEENFKFKVIDNFIDQSLILLREQYWIDYFQSADEECGYNISPTAGNLMGFKHSDETKRKISTRMKGKEKTSEHLANISNSLKGRKMSKEVKEKLLKANIGKKHTKEHREKISKHHYGKKLSEAHKEVLVNSRKKFTKETVLEIREKVFSGARVKDLMIEYDCSKQTILRIKKMETYLEVWESNSFKDNVDLEVEVDKATRRVKLTHNQVVEIFTEVSRDKGKIEFYAQKFGVSTNTIYNIISGRTWYDITSSLNTDKNSIRRDNSSGITGVKRQEREGRKIKWIARLTYNKKQYAKAFNTEEEAIEYRKYMELERDKGNL